VATKSFNLMFGAFWTPQIPSFSSLQGCNNYGWWLPPMEMKAGLDFKVRDVARTTSAAPAFLPRESRGACGLAYAWLGRRTSVQNILSGNDLCHGHMRVIVIMAALQRMMLQQLVMAALLSFSLGGETLLCAVT
jgi:hypothetical protein